MNLSARVRNQLLHEVENAATQTIPTAFEKLNHLNVIPIATAKHGDVVIVLQKTNEHISN